jgi:hypothetical protein
MNDEGLDLETGLMNTVADLLLGIEQDFGKERARQILRDMSYAEGEKAAKEAGTLAPEDAMTRLQTALAPSLSIKIVDTEARLDIVTFTVQMKGCVIRKALIFRSVPYPASVCRLKWGFMEGFLEAATGTNAKAMIYESSISDTCVGTITLTGKPRAPEVGGVAASGGVPESQGITRL